MQTLAEVIAERARNAPDAPAFLEGDEVLSWSQYAARSDRLAGALLSLGLEAGERVAVWLPDGPGVHVAYLAAEKAGLVVVGIGPRAGFEELRHLLALTGARALLCAPRHGGVDAAALVSRLRGEGLPLAHHLCVEDGLGEHDPLLASAPEPDAALYTRIEARRLRADALFLLNSTSGTTGLPKCVTHDQKRWIYFHGLAVEAGALRASDVFLSALPSPFGFGLWTAHFTPSLLGAPTVLMARFTPEELIRRLERHRVSVLAAVSTQMLMLLDCPELARRDLRSLRVLFTGGERVPPERAAEFEDRTGARVLQFYGSNETGALSRTTLRDSRETRLHSAGHVIDDMQVRLYDDAGFDVTASGRGQAACRGPATSRGYYGDPEANRALYTADGWMRTGDLVTLDADGILRVVGRAADIIIRGGKNISGPAVEAAVATHPAVALAAAVAMPDRIFGERVCVYAQLRPGASLTLDELTAHLESRGVSRETLPERLIAVDELPRSSGGKIAKQQLREDLARRLAGEA